METYDRLRCVLWDASDIAATLRLLLPRAADLPGAHDLYYVYRLAQVEYDQGDAEIAEDTFKQVLEALDDPTRPRDTRVARELVLTNLGRVLLTMEKYSEARLVFQEAYLINRQNKVAVFYLIELDGEMTSGRFLPISAFIGEGPEGGSR